MSAAGYILQIRLGRHDSFDLIRESDGATVAQAWMDPEASCHVIESETAIEELNRLSAENLVLRREQDERTRRLRAEVDTLKAQLSQKSAEAEGQGTFWPAIQY